MSQRIILHPKVLFTFMYLFNVHVCWGGAGQSVLIFGHEGSVLGIELSIRLGSKCLYLLSYLNDPVRGFKRFISMIKPRKSSIFLKISQREDL